MVKILIILFLFSFGSEAHAQDTTTLAVKTNHLKKQCFKKKQGHSCYQLGELYAYSYSPGSKFWEAAGAYLVGCELRDMESCVKISTLVWDLGENEARSQAAINNTIIR